MSLIYEMDGREFIKLKQKRDKLIKYRPYLSPPGNELMKILEMAMVKKEIKQNIKETEMSTKITKL